MFKILVEASFFQQIWLILNEVKQLALSSHKKTVLEIVRSWLKEAYLP